jgi:hypothetical protein
MRRALALTLTAVALCCAACGTASGPAAPSASGAPSSTNPSTAGTALTVTARESPEVAPQTWTLTCDPAGGTHPDPAAACAALAAADDPFAPVPDDVACTQQYGGPQTATVVGTHRGEPVDAAFSRTDGCQISRWDAVAPLLVVPAGV